MILKGKVDPLSKAKVIGLGCGTMRRIKENIMLFRHKGDKRLDKKKIEMWNTREFTTQGKSKWKRREKKAKVKTNHLSKGELENRDTWTKKKKNLAVLSRVCRAKADLAKET